ncbi:hypothetical protein GPECTOR_4g865 [Gonium pectorale]|uniref:Uncharacterized protein n=1 Tax=Gonium pectorale TaxID=33097 RepID=A0A150GYC2_GONPE|nr:hypothetical protein GPECTOR_4g865 [Gonium pectorale]|eukprot:KXZ54794.1 hypothetical protein GPECTOR_4g865 [Gonium pectorale]
MTVIRTASSFTTAALASAERLHKGPAAASSAFATGSRDADTEVEQLRREVAALQERVAGLESGLRTAGLPLLRALAAALGVGLQEPDGFTPLQRACRDGDLLGLRALRAAGVDVNDDHFKAKDGETLLCLAVRGGHEEVVRELLSAGACTHGIDTYPIHIACKTGRLPIVLQLLDQGRGHVEAKDQEDMTPLYIAAREGHVEVVKALLGEGADIYVTRGKSDFTPLVAACWAGHTEVVEELLAAGADPNTMVYRGDDAEVRMHVSWLGGIACVVHEEPDASSWDEGSSSKWDRSTTPLIMAVERGHTDVLRALLRARANIEGTDGADRTALYAACENGHAGMVRLLLDAGAKKNETFTNVRT